MSAPRLCLSAYLLFAVMFAMMARGQQTVKEADAPCARCHREIYNRYLATPMANASGRAVDHLLTADFVHIPSGTRYKIYADANAAWLSSSNTTNAQAISKQRLDYFLGSGHLGVTYLYTQQGYLLESPVAWYAATGGYDMKPGYEKAEAMPAAIPVESGCLRCHMSGVAHTESGTRSRYAGLPFAQTGITCESCHGDASAHVRSGGKASVLNPAKLGADRRDSICMNCHLEGDVAVERPNRSAVDYRPGERLSDFLSFFVQASADPLDRGVSEVEQFAASRCKRVSGESMSCTTCHDPHRSPSSAERVAFYRAKCLTCHSSPQIANKHHPETPDCAGCHMQRTTARNIPHVAWTDHRILREPVPALRDRFDAKSDRKLTAIFSPMADARDAALAAYITVRNGQSKDLRGTLATMQQLYASGERDPHFLEALGVLDGLRGDAVASEKHLRELLAAEPLNPTALSNLGFFAANRGEVPEAVKSWKLVFDRNQTDLGLARNLAVAQCALGDKAGGQKTIDDALQFSPGAWKLLATACVP